MASSPILVGARSSYVASLLANVAYGVYLVIAGENIATQVKKSSHSRVKRIMLGYSMTMLLIVSTWFCLVAATNEKTDVEGLLNPSGRSASTSCSGLGIAREAFGTIMIWAADTLLLWRLYIVWDKNLAICAFPSLIFLASVGMGLALNLSCLTQASAAGPIKVLTASRLSAPFIGLSIALNFTATALISIRLLQHRRRLVTSGMGTSDAAATYTSLAAIIVESAAMYTGAGIVFIPFLIGHRPIATVFSTIYITMAFLAPALIQRRIGREEAYTVHAVTSRSSANVQLTTLAFMSSRSQQGTTRVDSSPEIWINKEVERNVDAA